MHEGRGGNGTRDGSEPDLWLEVTLQMRGVCGFVVGAVFGGAREGDDARVGRPGEAVEIEAVVLIEDSELMSGRVRSAEPEVVVTFGVFDPGEAVTNRRGGKLGGIRRAEYLLKRVGLLC